LRLAHRSRLEFVRHLSRNPDRDKVAQDLRDNIHAVPAWMYPLVETITRRIVEDQTESAPKSDPTKGDLHVPLEADIAALPSVNQQQRALAEKVDETERQYISGSLRKLLTREIAVVEEAAGRPGHFSLGFGFEALDILVFGYKSVFASAGSYVQAAVRIEGGARPDPEPAEPREIVPTSLPTCRTGKALPFGT
jgi:hypothetical protein